MSYTVRVYLFVVYSTKQLICFFKKLSITKFLWTYRLVCLAVSARVSLSIGYRFFSFYEPFIVIVSALTAKSISDNCMRLMQHWLATSKTLVCFSLAITIYCRSVSVSSPVLTLPLMPLLLALLLLMPPPPLPPTPPPPVALPLPLLPVAPTPPAADAAPAAPAPAPAPPPAVLPAAAALPAPPATDVFDIVLAVVGVNVGLVRLLLLVGVPNRRKQEKHVDIYRLLQLHMRFR